MRRIYKKSSRAILESFNLTTPEDSNQAKKSWKRFGRGTKKLELKEALKHEQYGLCAYTEIRPEKFNMGFHIEHIAPKSIYPSRTFDYMNLVLCAISDEDENRLKKEDGNREDKIFGGKFKLSQFDQSKFVSPLQSNCEKYFSYLSDGQIVPSKDLKSAEREDALYTIELLNLNCQMLRNFRKNRIDDVDKTIEYYLDNDLKLDDLAIDFLIEMIGENAMLLHEFFTATKFRFGPTAERALKEKAPSLL